jgi:hypothetical protein
VSDSRIIRAGAIVNRVLSWAAVVLVALFVAEAASLRFALGHWPVLYRDQPPGRLGGALDAGTSLLFTALFVATPVWCASLWPVWLQGRTRGVVRSLVLFLGSIALLVAAVILNPGGFPEWWLD